MIHDFNSNPWEAQEGRHLSSKSAWSMERVPEQQGQHKETMAKN